MAKKNAKSLIEIVETILLEAIARGSSTIRFAYNIKDAGKMQVLEKNGSKPFEVRNTFDLRLAPSINARLKILAGVSIANHDSVQIGMVSIPLGKKSSGPCRLIRVISLPAIFDLRDPCSCPVLDEIVIQIGAEQ